MENKTIVVKKKRGRPRTRPLPDPNAVKRPVGRPRQPPKPKPPKVKKKLGRPFKKTDLKSPYRRTKLSLVLSVKDVITKEWTVLGEYQTFEDICKILECSYKTAQNISYNRHKSLCKFFKIEKINQKNKKPVSI